MYLISEFSQITKLTVKTLHYYDKEGLLIPYKRDQQTGYRYYNQENYQQAQTIALLRQLDFSILEIKDVLSAHRTDADFSYFLKEKRQQVETRIETDQQLRERLTLEINGHQSPNPAAKRGDIQELTCPAQLSLSQAFYGSYDAIGPLVARLYKAAGPFAAGPLITLNVR